MTRPDLIVTLMAAGGAAALAAAGHPRPALAGVATFLTLLVCRARKAALVAATLTALALVLASTPVPPGHDRSRTEKARSR